MSIFLLDKDYQDDVYDTEHRAKASSFAVETSVFG